MKRLEKILKTYDELDIKHAGTLWIVTALCGGDIITQVTSASLSEAINITIQSLKELQIECTK